MTDIPRAIQVAREHEKERQVAWGTEANDPALPLAVMLYNLHGNEAPNKHLPHKLCAICDALQNWADGVGEPGT